MDCFYEIMYCLLDTYSPISKVTVTSRDPSFITPAIKPLLRKKNHFMRKGRVDDAEAIKSKVRKAIIAHNSNSFKGIDSRSGAAELWEKARQTTGKSRSGASSEQLALFSAEQLNDHFSMQSNDAAYQQSNPKLT